MMSLVHLILLDNSVTANAIIKGSKCIITILFLFLIEVLGVLFHRCLRSMPCLLILRLELYLNLIAWLHSYRITVSPSLIYFVYDSQEVYLQQLVILAHTVGMWYVSDMVDVYRCITTDVNPDI